MAHSVLSPSSQPGGCSSHGYDPAESVRWHLPPFVVRLPGPAQHGGGNPTDGASISVWLKAKGLPSRQGVFGRKVKECISRDLSGQV